MKFRPLHKRVVIRRVEPEGRSTSRRAAACCSWSGSEVKLDGEDLLIMSESAIMGVIDNRDRRHHRRR